MKFLWWRSTRAYLLEVERRVNYAVEPAHLGHEGGYVDRTVAGFDLVQLFLRKHDSYLLDFFRLRPLRERHPVPALP
jgi:hypothetical protein